jgi:hypothetical protein
MDAKRQGEAARAILKHLIHKERGLQKVQFVEGILREVGHSHSSVDFPCEEALEFMNIIVRELVEEEIVKQSSTDIPDKIEKKY